MRTYFYLLILALFVGLTLRVVTIADKTTLTHDEGISYLAAAAKQGSYFEVQEHQAYPYGEWVQAAEWKQFYQPDNTFAFGQISRDLAQTDIHPPLYFWLLHIWLLLFGVQAWTGPSLNLLFFVAGYMVLFQLAHSLLQNRLEATVVCIIWAISPALLQVTIEARQYELFGLCTILFIWALHGYTTHQIGPKWWQWIFLVITVLLGALTHFHFILVVVGGCLIWVLRLFRSKRKRFIGAVTAVITGYALFFLIHPQFFNSILSLANRQQTAVRFYGTGIDLLRRIYATADTFTQFWVLGQLPQIALFCLFISFIIWLSVRASRNHHQLKAQVQSVNTTGKEAFYLFIWLSGITIALYLLLITPSNGMEPRHMSSIWPFYAFLPIFAARFARKPWQKTIFITIITTAFFASTINLVTTISSQEKIHTYQVQVTDHLIIDTVHRGILPVLFWQAPDEAFMLAAEQTYLLNNPELWQEQLQSDTKYGSNVSYNNTEAQRDQLIRLFETSSNLDVEASGAQIEQIIIYQLSLEDE